MKIKNKIRILLLKILGSENVDTLRYIKFKYKFGKFSRYKDKNSFIKAFSRFYEPEMALIPKILNNPEVIIDIGANYGTYSFYFSKLYPNSKIFAFEPSTRTFNIFGKIIKKFNLKNVIPLKKGLGSKEEKKKIVMPAHYTILAYDFIKCDVEGFEFEVFKGAKNTLKNLKPIVFVEVEERHTRKYGTNSDEVLNFFKKLNYLCYSIRGDTLTRTDLTQASNPLYLFVHKSTKLPFHS